MNDLSTKERIHELALAREQAGLDAYALAFLVRQAALDIQLVCASVRPDGTSQGQSHAAATVETLAKFIFDTSREIDVALRQADTKVVGA